MEGIEPFPDGLSGLLNHPYRLRRDLAEHLTAEDWHSFLCQFLDLPAEAANLLF